jgi:hypothetical protein
MNEITFESILAQKDVTELFRMRIKLTEANGDLHHDLHDGNMQHRRSEIIKTLNVNQELIDYLAVRIKERKNEVYIEEKEQRYRLRQFKDLCKARLAPELFNSLEAESKL